MKRGDRVELKLRTAFARRMEVGVVFTGVVVASSPTSVVVEGHSILRPPPPSGDAIPCRLCARPLTDPASQSIGYGSDCAVSLGLTNKVLADLRRPLTRSELQAAERRLKRRVEIPRDQIEATRRPGETAAEEALLEARLKRMASRAEVRERAMANSTSMRHEEIDDTPLPIPLPLDCELRPYQWRAVRFMLEACRAGTGVGLWDKMGLGKSIESILFMLAAAIELQERGKHGPAVVVCPPIMTLTWKRELEKWWQGVRVQVLKGYDAVADPRAGVYVLSWSILARGREPMRDGSGVVMLETRKRPDGTTYQAPKPDPKTVVLSGSLLGVLAQHPTVLVADECLPYNAMVDTDRGSLPIGRIVERQLPVRVRSYNVDTRTWTWQPVVRWLRNRPRQDFVRVVHERGDLVCTPNHKIWTENRGYVEAGSLTPDDYLRVVSPGLCGGVRSSDAAVLLQAVRHTPEDGRSGGSRSDLRPSAEGATGNGMCMVQQDLRAEKGEPEAGDPVLWDIMLGEVAHDAAGDQDQVARARRTLSEGEPAEGPSGYLAQDATAQPDARPGSQGEDQSRQVGEDLPVARREGPDHAAAAVPGRCSGVGQGPDRVCDPDHGGAHALPVASARLHGGPGGATTEDRHRGRREITPEQEVEVPGSEEGTTACIARVVRVEVHESACVGGPRGNREGDPVTYDIEVQDTHNYLADGVLVSNCHNAKTPLAQRSLALQRLGQAVEHTAALTGTAVLNRASELITQLDLLGILDREFGGRDQFEIEFANKQLIKQPIGRGRYVRRWDYKPATGAQLVELHQRLIPYVIRRRTEDVLKDMPPLTVSRVTVELANRADYDALEEEIAALPPQLRMGKRMQLRQLCGIGKIPSAIEWVENFLECDEKLIVFANHQAIQLELIEHFKQSNPVALLGRSLGSTDKKRAEGIDRFQNDPACLLAICSSGAAREGITLTASANILDVELEWTPGIQDQKWARARRLGQVDPVTVWVLAAEESMDDTLLGLLADKRRITGEVLDGRGEVLDEELIARAVIKDLVARVARRKRKVA